MLTIELNYFGLSVSKNHRHRAQEIKGLSWKLTSYNLQLFVLSPTFLESTVQSLQRASHHSSSIFIYVGVVYVVLIYKV